MLSLTFSFFLVEIIYGHLTNSLALVGDAYHMLSDVVALCVGLASVRISKWSSDKNTYGWARAEVLGALTNSVFLIALCFTILIEAIQRLAGDEEIENPDWLLYVGIAGLVVNLIGLALFHNVSHGHGHSHGGGGGGHKHEHSSLVKEEAGLANGTLATVDQAEMSDSDNDENGVHVEEPKARKNKSSAQLNMRAVFLHVLGDALGSVIVIVSALVIKYVKADWRYKVDPAMSMGLVAIIFCTTIPVLKASAMILLQTVPTHIQVDDLQQKLVDKIEGVLAVHEFHIWQLAGNRIIASAHIRCRNLRDYMQIAEQVKVFFHNEGIHSTTIQPEFVEFEETETGRDCVLECGPDKTCYTDTCCATKKKGEERDPSPNGMSTVRQRLNGRGDATPDEECVEVEAITPNLSSPDSTHM